MDLPLLSRASTLARRTDGHRSISKPLSGIAWGHRNDRRAANHHQRGCGDRLAFEDGAFSFMLSKDATFEDLADQLGRLGARHHGKPVAIEVKLAALSALRDAD